MDFELTVVDEATNGRDYQSKRKYLNSTSNEYLLGSVAGNPMVIGTGYKLRILNTHQVRHRFRTEGHFMIVCQEKLKLKYEEKI